MRERFLSFLQRKAWPNRSLDNLLRVALVPDEAAAVAAWRDFETNADFDHLTAGEMRLIGLAATRLAGLAPDSPMLARIVGIERANWSRSHLAISAAADGLRTLAARSIGMLSIKGASRLASKDPAARARMVDDVDIVVRPGDLLRAFDLLTEEGWRPAGSGTVVYHRSRLADAVGINLVRGRLGNLDLHRTPFHRPYQSHDDDPRADDASIWSRALEGSLGCVPIHVPSPTDAVAIAIGHGALDPHKSSDWLADIAAAIDKGVDWDLLEAQVDSRRLHAPAAVALGYVDQRLGRPVPGTLLARFGQTASRRPFASLAALAKTRPKTEGLGMFWIVRALSKQTRLLRSRPSASHTRIVRAIPGFRRRSDDSGPTVFSQELSVPDSEKGQAWRGTSDLTISVELPPASRRIDFEVNSSDRHLARLREVVLNRGKRDKRDKLMRFRVPLALGPQDDGLVLTAAASRSFNDAVPQDMMDQYGPTPFRMVHFRRRGRRNRAERPATLHSMLVPSQTLWVAGVSVPVSCIEPPRSTT